MNSSLKKKSGILEKQAKDKINDLLKKQRALNKKHGSLENEYKSLQKEKKITPGGKRTLLGGGGEQLDNRKSLTGV